MRNFCTTCDINYLPKALCLYESIKRHNTNFTLHFLTLDKTAYQKVSSLNLENVVLYDLEVLEKKDAQLVASKTIKPVLYGDEKMQYCWALTPYFINHVLNGLQDGEKLLYCDSDIYLYGSPQPIFDSLDSKSVTIHTHRFSGSFDDDNVAGWYNVGVTGFKKDSIGIDISKNWKSWLLDTNNPYYERYGTCGDQKYLNLFSKLWGSDNICVFDEDCDILHYAPWCTHNPKNQQPLFYHFSHFVTDFQNWRDSLHGEWNPSKEPHIYNLYLGYFEEHKKIKEKYNL